MSGTLVLVRHGQSEWNLKNLFTGWRDVDLGEQGLVEAKAAGPKAEGARTEIRHRLNTHEGHRYMAIIEMLVSEGFPRRSKAGFNPRLRKLGYGRGWGRAWISDEDELLAAGVCRR